MASLRDLLLTVIKSLFRGRSFLQALLAFWTTSTESSPTLREPASKDGSTSISDFLAKAESLLLDPTQPDKRRALSQKLKLEFREGLLSNPACMLPSYHTELPTGDESGQYLAVDVGGSTLRVALVDLKGRGSSGGPESVIVSIDTFNIDNDIRALKGRAFFNWMAEKIYQTVAKDSRQGHCADDPLLLGLSWSFPIEQPAPQTYLLRPMGKSFHAADGLLNQNLSSILQTSCLHHNLHVSLSAIVNDASATLLSAAYSHPSTTTFGLILGTGVNIAAYLPVTTISPSKLPPRPQTLATHVVVNTELGMFGGPSLPSTKWDKTLKASHPRPDFQPLEHLVSGFYLGEVARLILVDAIHETGAFGGVVPDSLAREYTLDAKTLSLLESDPLHFQTLHPSPYPPSRTDLALLTSIASLITQRSASILAASLHALHEINLEASSPQNQPQKTTTIAYTGSVIEHYPHYLSHLQSYLDQLTLNTPTTFKLVPAKQSSVLGAAVALACLDKQSTRS
ncbi:N-acetylglucosamine kinase 1 [Podospora pseudoanserina]|uniref:Phosphotransferase n=1 Tax=Podospora pseudoanserina TaxID=2609844 RepID=A0ABR0IA62_9PEZI|nr:N-acetylglucosamine kinase 1 [Podospora pseudoanserina]